MRSILSAAALLGAITASITAAHSSEGSRQLVKRQQTFSVTSPGAGDTVAVGTRSYDTVVPIEWTVPVALEDRPVIISLLQGDTLNELATIINLWSTSEYKY